MPLKENHLVGPSPAHVLHSGLGRGGEDGGCSVGFLCPPASRATEGRQGSPVPGGWREKGGGALVAGALFMVVGWLASRVAVAAGYRLRHCSGLFWHLVLTGAHGQLVLVAQRPGNCSDINRHSAS